MPQVRVNLYASLRRYVDGAASVEATIDAGQTVGQLLAELGVPVDQTRILFVDSRAAPLDRPLHGGESVGVFPALGGG